MNFGLVTQVFSGDFIWVVHFCPTQVNPWHISPLLLVMDSDDSDSHCEIADNLLVSGSQWTVDDSNNDANGQAHARKPSHPYDRIIAEANRIDVEQFPDCTTPHFKVATRDASSKGFLFAWNCYIYYEKLHYACTHTGLTLLCHTSFEKKDGSKKWTVKNINEITCHFRIQANTLCVIHGNTRNKGPGPINLEHSCSTAQFIQQSADVEASTGAVHKVQRTRNMKLSSIKSAQIDNYSVGSKQDSAKHV